MSALVTRRTQPAGGVPALSPDDPSLSPSPGRRGPPGPPGPPGPEAAATTATNHAAESTEPAPAVFEHPYATRPPSIDHLTPAQVLQLYPDGFRDVQTRTGVIKGHHLPSEVVERQQFIATLFLINKGDYLNFGHNYTPDRRNVNFARDMSFAGPQMEGRGMARAVEDARKLYLGGYLSGMDLGKAIATLDPKKPNAIDDAIKDKMIGSLKDQAVDNLQEQLTSDEANHVVDTMRQAGTLKDVTRGYLKPEDPMRRAARVAFDALTLPLKLINNDLQAIERNGERTRNVEYARVILYVESLSREEFLSSDMNKFPPSVTTGLPASIPKEYMRATQIAWARRWQAENDAAAQRPR